MTNDECRKNDEIRMPKKIQTGSSSFEYSLVSSFVIRHSCFVILMFVCFVGPLKFQAADVFDVRCLPCTKQRDEDGKAHRDFRRCDGYDEKDKHLRVVIGQAAWTDSESRKGNEGQACRIKHQLQ